MPYHCSVCGSQEIKETYRNKFGRKMRYQSHFGKNQYCSRDCMFIGLYRRQFYIGSFAALFFIAFGITLIILFSNWGLTDIIFIPILATFVGVFISMIIFRQGIKGKRLKEEREFKGHL